MKEVLALALLLLAPAPEADSVRLKRLFDLHWETRLRESPEFATYIGHPNDRWADDSPEGIARGYEIGRQELAALSAIDRSRLTEAEQVNYDLFSRRLERQDEGRRFHELQSYLLIDHMGGIDIELVQLLDYMPARTVQDYEAMLTRMRGFPRVVDQTLASLAKGLEAGVTPTKVTLRGVPERVASLLGPESRVLARFREAPDARLRAEAGRVFAAQVEPALRRLRDYLANTYIPRARETIAMSDLPDGKAWYAFALRTNTTTSLTPEQIHQLGLSEVRRIRGEMDALIAATGFRGSFAEFSEFLRTDPRFFYDRPEDLVAGYRDIAKRIDPALIKLFGRLPRLPYGVKALEGDGAKSAPAGYYNNGSAAGGFPGWFLVNTYGLESRAKWTMEASPSTRPCRATTSSTRSPRKSRIYPSGASGTSTPPTPRVGRSTRKAWAASSASTRIPIRASAGSAMRSGVPSAWSPTPACTRWGGAANRRSTTTRPTPPRASRTSLTRWTASSPTPGRSRSTRSAS